MLLYPKISNEVILLDNDCKRLLRRESRQNIIKEVMYKLLEKKKNNTNYNHIDSNNTDYNNTDYNNTNSNHNDSNGDNKKSLYQIILSFLGCNIKDS